MQNSIETTILRQTDHTQSVEEVEIIQLQIELKNKIEKVFQDSLKASKKPHSNQDANIWRFLFESIESDNPKKEMGIIFLLLFRINCIKFNTNKIKQLSRVEKLKAIQKFIEQIAKDNYRVSSDGKITLNRDLFSAAINYISDCGFTRDQIAEFMKLKNRTRIDNLLHDKSITHIYVEEWENLLDFLINSQDTSIKASKKPKDKIIKINKAELRRKTDEITPFTIQEIAELAGIGAKKLLDFINHPNAINMSLEENKALEEVFEKVKREEIWRPDPYNFAAWSCDYRTTIDQIKILLPRINHITKKEASSMKDLANQLNIPLRRLDNLYTRAKKQICINLSEEELSAINSLAEELNLKKLPEMNYLNPNKKF
jgi:hypothetical protein